VYALLHAVTVFSLLTLPCVNALSHTSSHALSHILQLITDCQDENDSLKEHTANLEADITTEKGKLQAALQLLHGSMRQARTAAEAQAAAVTEAAAVRTAAAAAAAEAQEREAALASDLDRAEFLAKARGEMLKEKAREWKTAKALVEQQKAQLATSVASQIASAAARIMLEYKLQAQTQQSAAAQAALELKLQAQAQQSDAAECQLRATLRKVQEQTDAAQRAAAASTAELSAAKWAAALSSSVQAAAVAQLQGALQRERQQAQHYVQSTTEKLRLTAAALCSALSELESLHASSNTTAASTTAASTTAASTTAATGATTAGATGTTAGDGVSSGSEAECAALLEKLSKLQEEVLAAKLAKEVCLYT
jgi:trimeric autotransporter adhesin